MFKRLRSQLKKAALNLMASRGRDILSRSVAWQKDDQLEAAQRMAERHRRDRERLAERNREPWFEVYKRHSGQQASSRRSPRERLQPLQSRQFATTPSSSPSATSSTSSTSPSNSETFDLPPDISPIELWRQRQQLEKQREEQQRQEEQQLQRLKMKPVRHPQPPPAARRRTTPLTLAMHPLQRARVISALTKRQLHRFRQRKLLLDDLQN
ncbi:nuclear transcription factor Y subunit beta-like [Drosophila ficusphila]|uniref:nuclear transcription factor Y subunit beta-like n=1 Tax=Drosophila ficusphila TaxID=30025 RepID=UPI0007E6A25B|nr:nuclear transcription factor Y subunit beta-like [Drosophila ficusphila]